MDVSTMNFPVSLTLGKSPSGIAGLDEVTGGGFPTGRPTLISGGAGAGKTLFAAHYVDAACRRGERCIYFAFEESPQQIIRNMRSIGLDLGQWVTAGLLSFSAARPSLWGLEMHLARMHQEVDDVRPSIVVTDPIYNLGKALPSSEVHSMLLRLIDFLKTRRITGLFISLDSGTVSDTEQAGVSSLMDTWLQLRIIEHASEHNHGLYILKSRGMKHSNQIRELILTDRGVSLREVYLGDGGVLTGSARQAAEAEDARAETERDQSIGRMERDATRKRHLLEQRIATLRAELEIQDDDIARFAAERRQRIAIERGSECGR